MVEVKYRDGKGPAQRIADRLKSSSPQGYQTETQTQPTRTNTCIYPSGTQGMQANKMPHQREGEQ
jgi:hypothetical protein